MIEYVTGFMFSNDEKNVALIRKNNPAWQFNKYNGVGGKIESNESPIEAMKREFWEETGVKTSTAIWKIYCILSRPGDYRVYFLRAKSNLVYDVKTNELEVVSIFETFSLPDNTLFNLRWLIPLALDKTLSVKNPVSITEEKP